MQRLCDYRRRNEEWRPSIHSRIYSLIIQEDNMSKAWRQLIYRTITSLHQDIFSTYTFPIMQLICLSKFGITSVFLISPWYYSRPTRNWTFIFNSGELAGFEFQYKSSNSSAILPWLPMMQLRVWTPLFNISTYCTTHLDILKSRQLEILPSKKWTTRQVDTFHGPQ